MQWFQQRAEDINGPLADSINFIERDLSHLPRRVKDHPSTHLQYIYHHKMTIKEPLVAEAWEWRQDYGCCYHNGCLFLIVGSCMVAVDRASRENGCMQVLRGSHQMGRVEHRHAAGETGADMGRVNEAPKRLELIRCVLAPGSGILFHYKTLHYSGPKRMPHAPLASNACYNAARNNLYQESGHPRYSCLEKWDDERVKGMRQAKWERLQRELANGNKSNMDTHQ